MLICICPILKESIRLLNCEKQALVYTAITLSLLTTAVEIRSIRLAGLALILARSIVGAVNIAVGLAAIAAATDEHLGAAAGA